MNTVNIKSSEFIIPVGKRAIIVKFTETILYPTTVTVFNIYNDKGDRKKILTKIGRFFKENRSIYFPKIDNHPPTPFSKK